MIKFIIERKVCIKENVEAFMGEYVLSCCSTADVNNEWYEKRNVNKIYFHLSVGEDEYDDNIGVTITQEELFKRMLNGEEAHSSQVNVSEYTEYFEKFLKEGKDIFHVTLTSGISGTINSARIAADELMESYPDRKIYIIDSFGASAGYGLLMDKLADLRDEGKTIDELKDFAIANRLKVQSWFFSNDLTFFIKGGRISKTSGTIGNLLNICPFMEVAKDGTLQVREKIRTKKKVIKRMVAKIEETAENGLDYSGKIWISTSDMASALETKAAIEEKFTKAREVQISLIGGTIGVHTGPGTVAVFFWGSERI